MQQMDKCLVQRTVVSGSTEVPPEVTVARGSGITKVSIEEVAFERSLGRWLHRQTYACTF